MAEYTREPAPHLEQALAEKKPLGWGPREWTGAAGARRVRCGRVDQHPGHLWRRPPNGATSAAEYWCDGPPRIEGGALAAVSTNG